MTPNYVFANWAGAGAIPKELGALSQLDELLLNNNTLTDERNPCESSTTDYICHVFDAEAVGKFAP